MRVSCRPGAPSQGGSKPRWTGAGFLHSKASALDEGIHLFNTRKFFEAHEALEAIWLKAHGDEKILLHGLIQVAAAFHHYTRHNPAGFRSLLEKGCKKLDRFGDEKKGIDLAGLRKQLQPWREFLDSAHTHRAQTPPSLPRILKTHWVIE